MKWKMVFLFDKCEKSFNRSDLCLTCESGVNQNEMKNGLKKMIEWTILDSIRNIEWMFDMGVVLLCLGTNTWPIGKTLFEIDLFEIGR